MYKELKALLCLGLSLNLVSCAVALTKNGSQVRQFSNSDSSEKCKFLGIANGSFGGGNNIAGDREGAMNDLKNNVASMGGDFFKLQTSSSSGFSTDLTAESFKCHDVTPTGLVTKNEITIFEEKLKDLKEAKDKGILTEKEYKKKVKELMDEN